MKTRSGRTASQQPNELYPFIDLLIEHGVTSYLELGARHGDTFFEVMTRLPRGSRGIAVDYPDGLWGSASSSVALLDCCDELSGMGYDIKLIFGKTDDVVGQVGQYDAVLIDADHTYDAVKRDFFNYGGCGIVAFHDIDGDGLFYCGEHEVGVPRLWRELKEKHKHVEFIAPSDDRRMGIGVLLRER